MKRIVLSLAALVRRAPVAVLAVVLVVSAVFGLFATKVEQASGTEGFAPDTPEVAAQDVIMERFGSVGDTVMQVLFRSAGGDLVSPQGVAATAAVQQALASSPQAGFLVQRPDQPPFVSFLAPLLSAAQARGIDPGSLDAAGVDALYRAGLGETPPEQAAFLTGLLPRGVDPPAAVAPRALGLLFLDSSLLADEPDQGIAVQTALADVIRQAPLPEGVTAQPFSFALVFGNADEFTDEVGRLFSLAFLIIVAILAFVYALRPRGTSRLAAVRRTAADVAVTMLVIVLAIVWVTGLSALLGPGYLGWLGPQAETGQIIPVLLIGLGVDYAIHLTTRYREELGSGRAVADSVQAAATTVGVALVLATVTTAVGFFTNVFTPVPAIRDFGVLAGLGIVSAFLLMLTVVPAVRLLLDRRAERRGRIARAPLGATSERLLPAAMSRLALPARRAPVATLLVTVLLGGGLGVVGVANLSTEFSFLDFVPEGSPLLATLDTIREDFGGGFGETTNVLLTGEVATAPAHNALVGAQARLAEVGNVVTFDGRAQAQSVVSALAQTVLPGPDGQVAAPALAQAAQAMGLQPDLTVAPGADVPGLYRTLLQAAPQAFAPVLSAGPGGSFDVTRVRVATSAGEGGAAALATALHDVYMPVAEAAGGTEIATSENIIGAVVTTALRNSQLVSLMVAILAAMALLVVSFWVSDRRPLLGFLTIAPVALIVLWTFGTMAATGIPVGPVTATIAALAVGIGVPYTIHVAYRFTEDLHRESDPDRAISSTVRHTGGALAGSALTTMAGFGILVTSTLTPFQQFGLVTVYAVGFALAAATVVLPSLLVLWGRREQRRGRLTTASAYRSGAPVLAGHVFPLVPPAPPAT